MVNVEKQQTVSSPNSSGKIHTKEQLIEEYPDHFKGIGRFPGIHKIHLQEGAKPVIHPQQKWPIAMHDKLKVKLDQMEKDEIITQVTEPTDWVNSLACSWRPDGDLRVCLDPKDLNKVIKRTYTRSLLLKRLHMPLQDPSFSVNLMPNQLSGVLGWMKNLAT